jgi:hypothetical protein
MPTPALRFLSRRRAAILALACAAGLHACSSTPEEPEGEPFVPPPEVQPEPTGYLLTKLDNELKAWQQLKLGASSPKDERTLRSLERQLAQETSRRQDDLLAELESRSKKNRAVAAVALGFTGDEAVVGPLLGALADPDAMVSHNALVGLGILAHPSTPLSRICYLLENARDGFTRVNAAYAIGAVVGAGGGDPAVEPACLAALEDSEPGVRAQAAGVLGRLGSADAIPALGDLLYDDTPLVTRAAAAALAAIGRADLEQKGTVARLMVDAAVRRKSKERAMLLFELRRLSSTDYGDDVELWSEWAHRLP